MILIPFVLRVVYFVVRRRSCKVELRGNSAVRIEVRRANQAPLTSFGAIRMISPADSQGFDRKRAQWGYSTVFLMELGAQGSKTDSPSELHVCKPPPCTCGSTGSGEVRKGMEEDVIDDADKCAKQQANGRCKKPLLKRGQEGMNVHGWGACPSGVKGI
jgi:hypothetical protein